MAVVHELMDPSRSPEPVPIVLCWGSRGGAVHRHLRELVDRRPRRRPWVHVCSEVASDPAPGIERAGDVVVLPSDLRPYEVALVLASRLGAPVRGFGRLRFPRLLLGALVVRRTRTVTEDDATRRTVLRRLTRNRRAVRRWIGQRTPDLLSVAGVVSPLNTLLGLAIEGLLAWWEAAPVRGRALAWYRPDGDVAAIEGLVQLGHQAALSSKTARHHVDLVLCRAFLTDLREEFRRASRAFPPSGRLLVILEGADENPLRDFLGILAELDDEASPMVLVAGSSTRGPRLLRNDALPERWPARDVGQASLADWIVGRAVHAGWATAYPLELTRPRPVAVTTAERRSFVERLARGHPLGKAVVAPAIADLRSANDWRGALAAAVREQDATDAATGADSEVSTVADVVLDQVLGGWSTELTGVLLRAAAAPDLSDDNLDGARYGQPGSGPGTLSRYRARDLWVVHPEASRQGDADDTGADPPPFLHPLARRVLLDRLAHPPPGTEHRWNHVHEELRRRATERREALGVERVPSTTELYHSLAVGNVHQVATELSARFTSSPVERWYADLLEVIAAPVQHPADEAGSIQLCDKLAEHADPDPEVPRQLVVALQLHTDPLGDPGHALCGRIETLLGALGGTTPRGRVYLEERAKEFRGCWELHHDDPGGS